MEKIGSYHVHNGHSIWELDTISGTISEIVYPPGYVGRKKVKMKENCVYVSALNLENAVRKFDKMLTDGK